MSVKNLVGHGRLMIVLTQEETTLELPGLRYVQFMPPKYEPGKYSCKAGDEPRWTNFTTKGGVKGRVYSQCRGHF